MNDPMNPLNPFYLMQERQEMKDLSPDEQHEVAVKTALFGCSTYVLGFILTLAICALLGSCAVPKAVERTEHHHAEADTMAIQTAVDARMNSWHATMDSLFRERISQYSEQQSARSKERELISETITTTTDSLGRAVRQEQRTISRDIQREQQQTIQRLEREMENRLQTALNQQDSIWQQRLDATVAHWQQTDSTRQAATPVAQDSRPWYRRWADNLLWLVLGIVLGIAGWILRRYIYKMKLP